jgi:hypothetical protein
MPDYPSSIGASGIWSLTDIKESIHGRNWPEQFPVVKEGLQLYLDAGNVSSYPGSGNIWYDLSGRSKHFSLTNPSFTSGSIPYFSTINRSMTGPESNSFGINNTSGYTIYLICNVNTPTNSGAFKFYSANGSSGSTSRGIFTHCTWSDGNIYFDQGGCCNPDTRTSVSGGTMNTWNIIVFRKNGDRERQIIKNNTVLATNTSPTADINLNSVNVSLGTADEYGGSSSTWDARIGQFIVYNRALNNSEMLYNHNALRTRYGL